MKTITVDNSTLVQERKKSTLSIDVAAAASTIDLANIVGFAVNQILVLGQIGNERTELVKTHASTAPSGSTVTLASALSFPHQQGTEVTILDFDQIEISHANTVTGSKTVLATIPLQVDQFQTVYDDSTYGSGYYYVRYKNTISNTFSDYSDPIPFQGYAENQVGYMLAEALKQNQLSTFTSLVTHEGCIHAINEYLRIYRAAKKKFSSLQNFDYTLGALGRGVVSLPLPSDMYQYSPKSVLDIRIEGGNSLRYVDEREWNDLLNSVAFSAATTGAIVGATSLQLDDTRNFDSSGTFMINGYLITYTANDKVTGTLSGIPASGTGSITAIITQGDMAWQGSYSEGDPFYYTIKESRAFFWPLVDSIVSGRTVILDYWKEAASVDSDYDTVDAQRFDGALHWLIWYVRSLARNNGIKDVTDADYLLALQAIQDGVKIELVSGQKYKMKPKLNKVYYRK